MHVVLTINMDDLGRLANGERIIVHNNVYLELNRAINDDELRKVAKKVRRSSPKKYKQCPACKGKSFINNSCCRTCEGSARILVRPEIRLGDRVTVHKFVMAPWGWQLYPRVKKGAEDHIQIREGSTGVVVDIQDGGGSPDDPDFIVDMVLDDKLYRVRFEGQYVHATEDD